MVDFPETRTLEQLPRAADVSPGALIGVQQDGGPMQAVEVSRIPFGDTQKLLRAEPVPIFSNASIRLSPWVNSVGIGGSSKDEIDVAIEEAIANSAFVNQEVTVDNSFGNDANDGTYFQPMATLEHAVRNVAASIVNVIGSRDPNNPRIYSKFQFRNTDKDGLGNIGNRLKLLRIHGHVQIEEAGPTAQSLAWVLGNGVGYVAPLGAIATNIRAILWAASTGPDGKPLVLRQYPDFATAEASGFGWAQVVNEVFIRVGTMNIAANSANFKIVYGDGASRIYVQAARLAIETVGDSSITFFGVQIAPYNLGALPSVIALRGNWHVKFAPDHGIDAVGSRTLLAGGSFDRSKADNIHYTDGAGGVSCLAIERDLFNRYAGDAATYGVGGYSAGTNNGSSMHLGGSVLRIGGVYEKNAGPNIADTGTGKSWNLGLRTGKNDLPRGDTQSQGFALTNTVEAYIEHCALAGADYGDLVVGNDAIANVYNTTATIIRKNNNGVVRDYAPVNL